jgi:uncharacterized membrane protein
VSPLESDIVSSWLAAIAGFLMLSVVASLTLATVLRRLQRDADPTTDASAAAPETTHRAAPEVPSPRRPPEAHQPR